MFFYLYRSNLKNLKPFQEITNYILDFFWLINCSYNLTADICHLLHKKNNFCYLFLKFLLIIFSFVLGLSTLRVLFSKTNFKFIIKSNPIQNNFYNTTLFILKLAEEAGVEPASRFLHGYGLANRWLTIRHTPPYFTPIFFFTSSRV